MWKHSLACLGREPFHVYLTYQKQGWVDPHLQNTQDINDEITTYDPWWKKSVVTTATTTANTTTTHTKIPWKEFRNDPSVLQCIARYLLYLFQHDINQTCEKKSNGNELVSNLLYYDSMEIYTYTHYMVIHFK
jgi:hypothetical protein